MLDLPSAREPVGCKRVFEVKNKEDGSVERYKARIVGKGYSQMQGIDYGETFASVTLYNSRCCIIALATNLGLDTDQLDIKCAFLNVDLVEQSWLIDLPGIGLDAKILAVDEARYGTKQEPLPWFVKLCEALAEIGFISLPFDPCVFISGDHKISLLLYVADITTAGSRSDVHRFIDHLRSAFNVMVQSRLKYILGIKIKHTHEGMELSPPQYITIILSRSGMENCCPVLTPIDPKTYFVKASGHDPVCEQNLYQRIIGSPMYLVTCTRPDVASCASYLSRFSSHPLERHHTAVKWVFRYLPGTHSMSLTY